MLALRLHIATMLLLPVVMLSACSRNTGEDLRNAATPIDLKIVRKDLDGFRGPVQFKAPNGNIVAQGTLDETEPVGEWRLFFPDGTLAAQITYRDGQPEGPYTLFMGEDPGQRVRVSGSLKNGKTHGDWEIANPAGTEVASAEFRQGELKGREVIKPEDAIRIAGECRALIQRWSTILRQVVRDLEPERPDAAPA